MNGLFFYVFMLYALTLPFAGRPGNSNFLMESVIFIPLRNPLILTGFCDKIR